MNRIALTATFMAALAQAEGQTCPNQQAPAQQTPVEQAPVQQAPVQQTPVEQAPVQQTPVQQAPVQQTPVQQPNQQQAPCPNQNQKSPAPCAPSGYEQMARKYAEATQLTHPESLMGRFGGKCFQDLAPNQPRPFLFEAKAVFARTAMAPFPMQILVARFAYEESSADAIDEQGFLRQATSTANDVDFGEPVQTVYFLRNEDVGSVEFRMPAPNRQREVHVKRVGNDIVLRYENTFCLGQTL